MNSGSPPLAGQDFVQRFVITDSIRQKLRWFGLLILGVGLALTLSASLAVFYTTPGEVEKAQVTREKLNAAEERPRSDPPPAPKPTFLVESNCDRPDAVEQIRYFAISPNQELNTGIDISIGDYIYVETDAPAGAVKFKFPGTYGASYYPIGRAGNLLFDTYKGKLLFTLEGAYAPGGFRLGVALLPRRALPARVCFSLKNHRKNTVLLYDVGCSGDEVYWESLKPDQETRWCIVPGRFYTVVRDVYSNELIKTIRDARSNMEIQIRGIERDSVNTAEPAPFPNSEGANRVARVQRSESTESSKAETQETKPQRTEQESSPQSREPSGHESPFCFYTGTDYKRHGRYHSWNTDRTAPGPENCTFCKDEAEQGCNGEKRENRKQYSPNVIGSYGTSNHEGRCETLHPGDASGSANCNLCLMESEEGCQAKTPVRGHLSFLCYEGYWPRYQRYHPPRYGSRSGPDYCAFCRKEQQQGCLR